MKAILATSVGCSIEDLRVHASTPECLPERFFADGSGNAQPPIENADYL